MLWDKRERHMPETPRHGHDPIAMKRVALTEIDNAGEFAWIDDINGRGMMLAVPNPNPGARNNYLLAYLPGNRWAASGNQEQPTLTPSVHSVGHWHGWVRDGMLVEA